MKCSSILPIVVFALALIGVVRANDQQTQQTCVNAAICLLAVRSGLSPDRRSDFQAHHTSLAVRRGLASNTYDQTCAAEGSVSWVTRFATALPLT
jgi:hypothetical protein